MRVFKKTVKCQCAQPSFGEIYPKSLAHLHALHTHFLEFAKQVQILLTVRVRVLILNRSEPFLER